MTFKDQISKKIIQARDTWHTIPGLQTLVHNGHEGMYDPECPYCQAVDAGITRKLDRDRISEQAADRDEHEPAHGMHVDCQRRHRGRARMADTRSRRTSGLRGRSSGTANG